MRHRIPVLPALLAGLLFLVPSLAAFAQSEDPEEGAPAEALPVYSSGQLSLHISAGLLIPLFFRYFDGGATPTNLSLGATGALHLGVHLDNHWMLGAEVGAMFARSLQESTFYMVPITARASYIFHLFPFEIPVFLGTGLVIEKYGDRARADFILKPGFSAVWKYNMLWSFGLNVSYWWVPSPWSDDPSKAMMGNFLDVTATVQRNF